MCTELQEMAYDEATDVADLVDKAQKSVFDIADGNIRKDTMEIAPVSHRISRIIRMSAPMISQSLEVLLFFIVMDVFFSLILDMITSSELIWFWQPHKKDPVAIFLIATGCVDSEIILSISRWSLQTVFLSVLQELQGLRELFSRARAAKRFLPDGVSCRR